MTGGQATCHTDEWKVVKKQVKEGESKMGEAWMDRLEAKGEEKGVKKGMIRAFSLDGHTLEEIAALVNEPISFVEDVLNSKTATSSK